MLYTPHGAQPRGLTVVGAGGHAKVVLATLRAAGWAGELELVDDNPALYGQRIGDALVRGPVAPVLHDPAAWVVLALGSNALRARLAASARCQFVAVAHPAAVLSERVQLGAGTVVFAGAVVQPDTTLGPHCIVNTGASVDHDCVLGAAVHIAPGARLAGGVTVGARSFIGIGAVVIPGMRLGADVRVGAGAAVVRDVSDGVTVVGVPARPLPQ